MVQKGLIYKNIINKDFIKSKQTIHVLESDLNEVSLKIAVNESNVNTTSNLAKKLGAFAAINGNFFDPENGNSVCFIKNNGSIINLTKKDPEELLFLPMLDEAAIAFKNDNLQIIKKPNNGWGSLKNYNTILSSGPLLIYENKIQDQKDIDFITGRHARTALGIKDDSVFLVVIDGYNPKAEGMSINELSKLMFSLGCNRAINLDGGGSSTMWIKDLSTGVANFPTDNKKFDHEGERKVSNSILLFKK